MKSYEELTVLDSVKIQNALLKIKKAAGDAQCCMAQAVILRQGESQMQLLSEVPKFTREARVWCDEILTVCDEPLKKNQSVADDRLQEAMKLLREAQDIFETAGFGEVDSADDLGVLAWLMEFKEFAI